MAFRGQIETLERLGGRVIALDAHHDDQTQIAHTGDPACEAGGGVPRTEACALAKANGTEIFVIAAMAPEEVSQGLGDSLRECSSQADNPDGSYVFLNNTTAEALEAAFAEIATQLIAVRRVY